MMKWKAMLMAAAMATSLGAVQAQVVTKHIQTDKSAIASGVWAGDTFYLSGILADPTTPADRAKGTPAVYGDTAAQSASVFSKIQAALKEQGLGMGDVVQMTVLLAADPATGKMDFRGMQSEFVKYFGTQDQPNKPARETFQAGALAAQGALIEVEVIAVKGK
jgi:enamine deaminase RidA (YjgF/YER057c/UK114 family)